MTLSIRQRLLLSHFGVILAVTLALGIISYVVMKNQLEDALTASLDFNAKNVAHQVEAFLKSREMLLAEIGTGHAVEDLPTTKSEVVLGRFLGRFQQDFPILSYSDPNGRERARVVRGQVSSDQNNRLQEPFLQAAVDNPGRVLVGPMVWSPELKLPVLQLVIGLKPDSGGDRGGVLLGGFPIRELAEFLPAVDEDHQLMVYLVNAEGTVLLAPNPNEVFAPFVLIDSDGSDLLSRILGLQNGLERATLMGTDSFVAFAPVSRIGWTVVAGLPHDQFTAGPNRLRDMAVAVFALICVGGLLGAYFLAAGIAEPLHRLTAAAEGLARGERPPLPDIDRGDEIGTLARAFGSMTKDLERTTVSRDALDNILRSMNDSLLVVALDGTIGLSNDATTRLLGYTREELIGRPVIDLFAEENKGIETWFDYLIDTRDGGHIEKFYLARDGRQIPVSFSSAILEGPKGRTEGVVCVALDVSARKAAEREMQRVAAKLEQSRRDLEDFAFIAAHDLQEPLRKIMSFGERLQSHLKGQPNDQGLDYLGRMLGAARRLQSLMQDLLLYSEVDTKAQPFKEVEVGEIVDQVLRDLSGRIADLGAQISVARLPRLAADPRQIRQLLLNLIDNALKFHREGVAPVIRISGTVPAPTPEGCSGTFCWLSVSDNGIGFEEQYLERISGVFQRLHGRDRYEGSGIGLAICNKIVKRHRGVLSAQSRPGEGATFIISLPLSQPSCEDPTVPG